MTTFCIDFSTNSSIHKDKTNFEDLLRTFLYTLVPYNDGKFFNCYSYGFKLIKTQKEYINELFPLSRKTPSTEIEDIIPNFEKGFKKFESLKNENDLGLIIKNFNDTIKQNYELEDKDYNLFIIFASYDVIDGQQRLTTLFLLLSYLQATREANCSGKLATSIFSLRYESRDSDFFDNKEFKNSNIEKSIRNIDFFYMTRAYKTIEKWFDKTSINRNKILKVLIPEDYICLDGLEGDTLQKKKEHNDKQNDVRFIWYEVPVAEKTDSIEVFSQLNYGKTALTATELVKALLFQCDIYSKDISLMREIAFRRSCEWDTMEKQLQNPFMWSMFMSSETYFASHITIVLMLVFNELYIDLKKDNPHLKINKDSEDFIYQVCDQYLNTNKEGDYAGNVEKIWNRI